MPVAVETPLPFAVSYVADALVVSAPALNESVCVVKWWFEPEASNGASVTVAAAVPVELPYGSAPVRVTLVVSVEFFWTVLASLVHIENESFGRPALTLTLVVPERAGEASLTVSVNVSALTKVRLAVPTPAENVTACEEVGVAPLGLFAAPENVSVWLPV